VGAVQAGGAAARGVQAAAAAARPALVAGRYKALLVPAVVALALLLLLAGSFVLIAVMSPLVALSGDVTWEITYYGALNLGFPGTPPEELRYADVDERALLAWLDARNSALATPARVRAIIEAGRKFDVHPLLLVAITGAEQSFVPRSNRKAEQIVKNPWNVYGCWCTHPLGTARSAEIAAHTVAKLSQDRPPGVDPIAWLAHPQNPRGMYATGYRNWVPNVQRFFAQLRKEVPWTRPDRPPSDDA